MTETGLGKIRSTDHVMGNSLRLGDLNWTMGVGFKGFKYGLLLTIGLFAMAMAACNGGEAVGRPGGADAGGFPSLGSPDASAQPELIRMDLGECWRDITGHPMVFAVYAAHRDAPQERLEEAHQFLVSQLESFENSDDVRNEVILSTCVRSGFSENRIAKYFDEVVNRLDSEGMDGLNHFLEHVCGLDSFQTVLLNP